MKSVFCFFGLLVAANVFAGPHVFDGNDRADANPNAFPNKAIGKLYNPGGGSCTAALVSSDLILTAAHCVINEKSHTVIKGDYGFYPDASNGSAPDSSNVSKAWYGTAYTKTDRANDWALLRLTKPLGDTYGWLGVESLNLGSHLNEKKFTLVGYSNDWDGGNTPSSESGCRFTGAQSGYYLHDCSTSPGSSGGPMYYSRNGQYFIVGINVAETGSKHLTDVSFSNGVANIAVSAQKFISTLISIKNGKSEPEEDEDSGE